MSAHVRLLVRDLCGSFSRYEPPQRQYRMATGPIAFSKVRVLGVCTKVTHAGQTCQLEIGTALLSVLLSASCSTTLTSLSTYVYVVPDDGTGAIPARVSIAQLLFDPTELRCGEMVRSDRNCMRFPVEPFC